MHIYDSNRVFPFRTKAKRKEKIGRKIKQGNITKNDEKKNALTRQFQLALGQKRKKALIN